jgi:hypothetical protein
MCAAVMLLRVGRQLFRINPDETFVRSEPHRALRILMNHSDREAAGDRSAADGFKPVVS